MYLPNPILTGLTLFTACCCECADALLTLERLLLDLDDLCDGGCEFGCELAGNAMLALRLKAKRNNLKV